MIRVVCKEIAHYTNTPPRETFRTFDLAGGELEHWLRAAAAAPYHTGSICGVEFLPETPSDRNLERLTNTLRTIQASKLTGTEYGDWVQATVEDVLNGGWPECPNCETPFHDGPCAGETSPGPTQPRSPMDDEAFVKLAYPNARLLHLANGQWVCFDQAQVTRLSDATATEDSAWQSAAQRIRTEPLPWEPEEHAQ